MQKLTDAHQIIKIGQRSDCEAVKCRYTVMEVTWCVVNTMFIANLHGSLTLPEGTALHNVCDILHVQLVSDVWFVTAISVHGLRVCHSGELLRKLHPHHLNHCKHGCVHKCLCQYWQAKFSHMLHTIRKSFVLGANVCAMHRMHASFDRACLLGCDCSCCPCACAPTARGCPKRHIQSKMGDRPLERWSS